jgi:hypothetical protein
LANTTPVTINGLKFLVFQTQNQNRVTTPDGCNCLSNYTTPTPNIVDPYTGEIGFGCQLTTLGLNDLQLGSSSYIINHYQNKANGIIPCV